MCDLGEAGFQVVTWVGQVVVLPWGALTKVSEHIVASCCPPQAYRPLNVFQERAQDLLGLVAHHAKCVWWCSSEGLLFVDEKAS